MFKKLIIAVLTLGLLLTFSSAAISSNVPKVGLNRLETTNPNAPRFNQATQLSVPFQGYQKPSNAINCASDAGQSSSSRIRLRGDRLLRWRRGLFLETHR